MNFKKNTIKDSYVINLDNLNDERGFFARLFCSKILKKKLGGFDIAQINNSFSKKKSTLRGMHFQKGKFAEAKIIRCIKGSIQDVIIDIRKKSPTYKNIFSINLSEKNRTMLYVPRGVAHGFLTLQKNCEVIYLVDNFYNPKSESGLRYNDKEFKIKWKLTVKHLSDKDKKWEDFKL